MTSRVEKLTRAVRLALPILDDDLASYQSDTPPALYDKRGYVCLDDLSCDHDRWKECEATLEALAAIRAVLPEAEWIDGTYAESQAAVEHFARAMPQADGGPDHGKVLTRVSVDLRAFHTDPVNDPTINEGRHEHVWSIQAIFDGATFKDARPLRMALSRLLEPYQGEDLPPHLWAGEDIARMVVSCLGTGDCIGAVVSRPGYAAEAWL